MMQVSNLQRMRMNVAHVDTGNANRNQAFTAVLESMRKSASVPKPFSTAATSPAAGIHAMASVSAPVMVSDKDAQIQEYLDTYKRIYDKYAAIYGDEFEFTPCYSCSGNKESEEAEQKIQQMLRGFDGELAANIPREFLLSGTINYTLEEGQTIRDAARLHGLDETRVIGNNYASNTVNKLFYEDKYGLRGLSAQEQIDAIMARFGHGTCYDFAIGIGILYQVSAITDGEFINATSEALDYARMEEFERYAKATNLDLADFLKEYYANIVWHMQNIVSAKYDWEDVFKSQPGYTLCDFSRDALIAKLFG